MHDEVSAANMLYKFFSGEYGERKSGKIKTILKKVFSGKTGAAVAVGATMATGGMASLAYAAPATMSFLYTAFDWVAKITKNERIDLVARESWDKMYNGNERENSFAISNEDLGRIMRGVERRLTPGSRESSHLDSPDLNGYREYIQTY